MNNFQLIALMVRNIISSILWKVLALYFNGQSVR